MQDRNGQAAYQRAGYTASPDAARNNAARLLANASVAARVAYLEAMRLAEVDARAGMTAEQVLRACSGVFRWPGSD